MTDTLYPIFIKIMLILTLFGSIIFTLIALYQRQHKNKNFLTSKFTITILVITSILTSLKLIFDINPINIINKITPFTEYIKKGILIIIILMILFKIYKKIKQTIKRKNEQFLEKIKEIKEQEVKQPWQTDPRITKIRTLERNNQKIAQKHEQEIENSINQLRNELKTIEKKEKAEAKQIKQEQQRKEQEQEKINNVTKHYLYKNSTKSIPDWALNYDEEIIQEAKKLYKKVIDEEKEREEKKQNAIKFVQVHEEYPSNFLKLGSEEKQFYHQAMQQLEKGELQPLQEEPEPETLIQQENEEKYNKLLKDSVHEETRLNPNEKEFLLQNGYRHKPFIHLHGTTGNNLLIKKNNDHESDYHFCIKHLFRELEWDHAKIEFGKGDLRADIAFVYPHARIAIEIETGTNKPEQIEKKVKWLNEFFAYWIFVCSRKNIKHYRKYVDNNKSFCLTLKEAKEKAEDLIEDINTIH